MIEVDMHELIEGLENCEVFLQNNMFDIAESIITPKIQAALDRGENLTGNVFPAYANSTVKTREKLGLQTAVRDLKRTGSMRNSIGLYDKTPHSAWITVASDEQLKALGHITGQLGRNTVEPSDFFQVDDGTLQEVSQGITDGLKDFIGGRI